MENKINIAEILKDCSCSSGMELDCTIYEDVYFDYVDELNIIHCYIQHETHKTSLTFNQYGIYNSGIKAKCVIFPKGKTTWEGFQRPFKDGDVVTWEDRGSLVACIYKERKNIATFNHHIALYKYGWGIIVNGEIASTNDELCFATEEEKEKLFQAIKDNGYKWDAETKTLEKLVEPRFKVGDRIILKDNPHNIPSIRIKAVTKSQYILENEGFFYIDSADEKYVLEDKFDISALIPFESRVLVRNKYDDFWEPAIFGVFYAKEHAFKFCIVGSRRFEECIPYECNEHLLGTTDDCDNYYKNW